MIAGTSIGAWSAACLCRQADELEEFPQPDRGAFLAFSISICVEAACSAA
jgi:hypothetical protein